MSAAAPRLLPELVRRLNGAGFRLSTAETLDAASVLAKLAERDGRPPGGEALREHLRPLLCKVSDAEARQRFEDIFDDWWDGGGGAQLEPDPPPAAVGVKPAEPPSPPRRRRLAWLLAGLLAALALAGWIKSREWALAIHLKNQQPARIRGPGPIEVEPVEPPPKPAADTPGPRVYGYWPAYRHTETLRPALAWLLVGAPFSLLPLFRLPAWALGRRRGVGEEVRLNGWDRGQAARRVAPPLGDAVAGRFDRHFRGPAGERRRLARRPPIDLPRTVQATIAKLGIPQLRYRHARLRPSYLLLVEAEADDAFPMLWAGRLQGLGLDVDLRRVELLDAANRKHPVPLCRSPQAGAVRFDRLPNPGPGQRLILVSDGAFLLDGPGKWQPWARAARLERWPRRTVFSPREPRNLLRGLDVLDHGMRPGDPGFLVLPQEESALEAWAAWLATGQMPVIVPAEAQRFPRLIAERGEQRYLDDNFEPEAGEVARLLGELGVYLGDNGFYWLCCCAVPPLLDSKLALLLGEAYLRRAGVGDEAALRYHLARNYRLLARLPWLRRQDMPDWLRLALLARLSSALQEEVRRAVDGLLSPLSQDPEGSLRLGFGLPDGPAKSPAPDRKTALYLGFMDGLSARQLMLRMPGRWRSWLGRLERGRSPWQRLKDWLAAAFARALFRDGLRRQGPALAVWLWMALSSSLLATAYYWPPPQWPESARGLLFAEDAQPLRFRHDAAVKSIAYGPGGRRLLTASADGNVRLWDTQTGRPLGQPIWHGEPLQQAAFSLDGTQIVTAGGQTARLWDAETGQALGQPLRHGGLVYRAAFSPDGKRVVTVGNDHTAKLWDAQSGRLLFKLQHENRVNDARFSPDGRRVLTASHDSSARLWDAQTGQFIAEMRHLAFVSRAVFSPDGKMIATASGDNSARLWDAQTGQSAGQPLSHEDWVNDVQFSPDSTRLLTASKDNTARLWDVHGSQPLGEPLKHGDDVWSARFNGGGDKVITASADHSARVWDAKTQKPLGEPLTQAAAVALAEFSPDGQQAATACADGEARLWNTQIGVSAGEAMRHESIINHAAYSPDGRRVVTASSDHTARLWDAQTGKPLGDAMRHEDWVNHAAFSRDGQYVATASRDGTARLWDAMTGKPLGDPMRHGSSVNYAEFSPDGGRLIVAGRDGVAQLWDVKTGKPLGDSMRHESSINHAEFSPDGQRVVTASNDKTAKQWNAQTGAPIGGPMRHEGSVSHAAYSPVGERIATASYDDTARLWDAKTNLALGDPMRHGRPVNDATFSPDGKTVATASWDNTAKLWDANNGQLLAKPLPHESLVRQARFSPDGKRIVTTSDDHTARLWDADTGMPLGVLPTSGVFLSAAFHSRGDRVLLAGTVENEPTLKKAIPAKPGDHEQSVKEQLFSLLPPSSKGEARIWRLPPYPEPRTAFQFSPASLTAAALALPPLLFALERVWHLLAMRRLRRRLDNYAPRGKAKPGAARTTGGPPPP